VTLEPDKSESNDDVLSIQYELFHVALMTM